MNVELVQLKDRALRRIREFFHEQGFLEVIPPVLVGATGACENVPTVFKLDYFGRTGFLAQTTNRVYLN